MSISATIAPSGGAETDGVGFHHPFLDAELVTVQTGLAFNYGKFAGIKIWVMDGLPDPEEFDGVAVAQPVGDEEIAILGFQHVGQGNVFLTLPPK